MTSKAFERDRGAAIARQRSLEAHRTAHAELMVEKARLLNALGRIAELPVHVCDDARNAAALQRAKAIASEAITEVRS